MGSGLVFPSFLSNSAQAEQPRNIALPRFEPAPAGDAFFGVASPATSGDRVIRVGAMLDYANDPLVLTDSVGTPVARVVAHQLLLHLAASVTLRDRLQLSADLPLAVVNQGDGTIQVVPFTGPDAFVSPAGGGLGDLRLGGRLKLYGAPNSPLQVALGMDVWTPTARRQSFLTDANFRVRSHVLLGGLIDRFLWTAMVGSILRASHTYADVPVGSEFVWGAGVGVRLGDLRRLQVGIETIGAVTLRQTLTSSEALLGAKYQATPLFELGLAVGRGLVDGLGTPAFRGLFSFLYRPKEAPPPDKDSDGDRIPDNTDACPLIRGIAASDPLANGCPTPADADRDGVPDVSDACPEHPGPRRADRKQNGCPSHDTDGDGLLDEVDACPKEPGVPQTDLKKNGCPLGLDRDADGVGDAVDACPDVAGPATGDPATNGCPPDDAPVGP